MAWKHYYNGEPFLKRIELAIRRSFIFLLSKRKSQLRPILPLELGPTPSILFLRQDRLGDAIITTPLLVAIKEKFPDAHIIMLLGLNNVGLAPLLPIECEILVYKKNFFHDILMLRKLRKRKIDVTIDLMDNASATSSILTSAIAAKYSIGIAKENATSYNILVPKLEKGKVHIGRRIAELLSPFNIDPDKISLKPVLKSINIPSVSGRYGVNISAGTISRYFSFNSTITIIHSLILYGHAKEVIVFSSPDQREIADKIVNAVNRDNVLLSAKTNTFEDFARELSSCEILISPDTSAVHLAAAFNIPVVAAYVPDSKLPDLWTPVGIPYEVVTHSPSLQTLDANEIIAATERLVSTMKTSNVSPSKILEEQADSYVA